MRKQFLFCVGSIALTGLGNSLSSLSYLAFDKYFDHKTWDKQKSDVIEKLNNYRLPSNIFAGQTVVGLDFSGMNLSNKDLTNCIFYKINLADVDLTGVVLDNTKFKDCNLIGAYFRYSLSSSSGIQIDKKLEIKSNDSYQLVSHYSDLMKEKEKKEDAGLIEDAADLGKRADLLNYLFSGLYLNLFGKDLNGFNLIDFNFKNANLDKANLQGVQLDKNFKIPPYQGHKGLIELCKEAFLNNRPTKQYYNKLINGRCEILSELTNEELKKIRLKELDLANANLSRANLQGMNLSGVNLKGANLYSANLRNANLVGTDFTETNLNWANLDGAYLFNNLQMRGNNYNDFYAMWYRANKENHPNKGCYNQLIKAKLDVFFSVSKDQTVQAMREGIDFKEVNLSNINFVHPGNIYNDGIELSEINLEKSWLDNVKLSNSKLTKINLAHINAYCIDFEKSNLDSINFNCSGLKGAVFRDATLKSVSFQGADLFSADFTGATFIDVDFFAASIKWLKLSPEIRLSDGDNDEDHIKLYHQCKDPKAKALLKVILESRGHTLEVTAAKAA